MAKQKNDIIKNSTIILILKNIGRYFKFIPLVFVLSTLNGQEINQKANPFDKNLFDNSTSGTTELKKYEIKFEYINDFIIIKLKVNGLLPLRFIFDTGSQYNILTDIELVNILNLPIIKEYEIYGSDLTTKLKVYLSKIVKLESETFSVFNNDILILRNNNLDLSKYVGYRINGIIGANFFKNMVVKINYSKHILTLIPKENFTPPFRKYKRIPIEIYRHRPYINCEIEVGNIKANTKLLIDTGAAMSVILYKDRAMIPLPKKVIESNLASGLGGSLVGVTGRLKSIKIGEIISFGDLVSYQSLPDTILPTYMNNRHGLLGNKFLSKGIVILDYFSGYMYFKKNKRRFEHQTVFNRCGIIPIASGINLNTYEVQMIIDGSPADLAGISEGDKIISINGINTKLLGASGIETKFKKKIGKKLRLKIVHKGETIKKTIILKEIL